MKARILVLSTVFVSLFAASASAQRYYRPDYTQSELPELQTTFVFLENRTDGHLRLKIEVNGLTLPIEVLTGHEVSDLKLPVGAKVKIKEARVTVWESNRSVDKKVKYYQYTREDWNTDTIQQGWLFYLDKSFRP